MKIASALFFGFALTLFISCSQQKQDEISFDKNGNQLLIKNPSGVTIELKKDTLTLADSLKVRITSSDKQSQIKSAFFLMTEKTFDDS